MMREVEAYRSLLPNGQLDGDALMTCPPTATLIENAKLRGLSVEDYIAVLLFETTTMRTLLKDGSLATSPIPSITGHYIPPKAARNDVAVIPYLLDGAGPTRQASVMVVGKLPSRDDNNASQVFAGTAGSIFRLACAEVGMDPEGWYVTNASKYSNPGAGSTIDSEMRKTGMCLLAQEIALVRPKYLLVLGADAVRSLFGPKAKLASLRSHVFMLPGLRNLGQMPIDSSRIDEFSLEYEGVLVFTTTHPNAVVLESGMRDGLIADLARMAKVLNGAPIHVPEQTVDYRYVSNYEKLAEVFKEIEDKPELAVDCEWGGSGPVLGLLRSIQFSWGPRTGCAFSLRKPGGEQILDDEELGRCKELIQHEFTRKGRKLIGHNFRADAIWLYFNGIDCINSLYFDTMLADHALNENAEHGLENCSVRYTDMGRYDIPLTTWWKANLTSKQQDERGYLDIPDELILPYSVKDVDCTFRCKEELLARLSLPDNRDVFDLFFNVIMPVNVPIHELEREGIFVDRDLMTDLVWQYNNKKEDILALIRHKLDNPKFNPRSNPQVKALLFGTLGLQPYCTTEKPVRMWEDAVFACRGNTSAIANLNPSTNMDTLEYLSKEDKSGICSLLADYRMCDQVCKSFLRLPDNADEEDEEEQYSTGLVSRVDPDGRMRTTINQMSESGRHKSSKPNLQNLPKKQEKELQRILDTDYVAMLVPSKKEEEHELVT